MARKKAEQQGAGQDPGSKEPLTHLHELIHGIRVAMMTTVEAGGSLRSRPMWTLDRDFNGELWFFTREHSAKVDEMEHDHHVNLSYADPSKDCFVSVTGRCHLVRDKEKVRELWSPSFKAWFPQGMDDPELALLCVKVEKAEYWDTPSGRMVQLIGFVKAALTGEPYQPRGNEKVQVDTGLTTH